MQELILYIKKIFNSTGNGDKKVILTHLLINGTYWAISLLLLLIGRSGYLDYFLEKYAYLPTSISVFLYKPWSLLTYFFIPCSFSIYGIYTCLASLSFLYFFSSIIMRLIGSDMFIFLYFSSGIFGGVVTLFCCYFLPYFKGVDQSIAIPVATYGVMSSAATFAPNLIPLLPFFLRIRLKYIATGFIFLLLLRLNSDLSALPQLGSALWGLGYVSYMKKNSYQQRSEGGFLIKKSSFASNFINKLLKKTKFYSLHNSSIRRSKREISKERLQELLDKVSSSGYQSLSKEEKEDLFYAGK